MGKDLIDFDFKRGYRALEGLCPYAAADIPKRIGTTDLVQRFETGLIEPRDFVEQLSRVLDLHLEYDHFCRIWSIIFAEPLIPESMLQGLASRYRMVLVSNTNQIHFEMLRGTFPQLRHFHDLVLSYEVKAMKPQREIFETAIERAQCRAGECFYTDDIAAYIEAAKGMGIDAVQFQSAGQIQQEMSARGISWLA